jgi:oligopeptide/dipeptide ABC transporter ATP-binding protein
MHRRGMDPVTPDPPLLAVEGLTKRFAVRRTLGEVARRAPQPHVLALDDVTISVPARRTLGIVGESGSGKSTLAKVIVRLIVPDEGAVLYRGNDLLRADRAALRRARRKIQLVYQDPYGSLNPRLAVGDAILEAARVHKVVGRTGEATRLQELLEQVGLPENLAARRPHALSGGQRQRVAIARALATQPELLIADEAVSALDVSVQAQILNLLCELQGQLGLTLIFISHQLAVVGYLADEVAVMYMGRIVEQGATASVFADPVHPYTAALLAAQPNRGRGPRRAPAVQGEMPSPLDTPSGCPFRTRCPIAEDICAIAAPARVLVSDDHSAWCHAAGRAQTPSEVAARPGS